MRTVRDRLTAALGIMLSVLAVSAALATTDGEPVAAASTTVVGMPWLLRNLFTTLFPKDLLRDYLKRLLVYVALALLVTGLNFVACMAIHLSPWPDFFVKLGISLVLPNLLLWALTSRSEGYRSAASLVGRMTNGKIKL